MKKNPYKKLQDLRNYAKVLRTNARGKIQILSSIMEGIADEIERITGPESKKRLPCTIFTILPNSNESNFNEMCKYLKINKENQFVCSLTKRDRLKKQTLPCFSNYHEGNMHEK